MTHVDVRIYEVGPRDGLQNEARTVPTDQKLASSMLAEAGLREIEATSFVARRHPAAGRRRQSAAPLDRRPGVRYPVLVPNARGLERAIGSRGGGGVRVTAASESFTRTTSGCPLPSRSTRSGP